MYIYIYILVILTLIICINNQRLIHTRFTGLYCNCQEVARRRMGEQAGKARENGEGQTTGQRQRASIVSGCCSRVDFGVKEE